MTYNNAPLLLLLLLYSREWKLRFFLPRNFRRENRLFGIVSSRLRDIDGRSRSFVSAALLYERELYRFSLMVAATFRQRFFHPDFKKRKFSVFFARYSADEEPKRDCRTRYTVDAVFARKEHSHCAAKIKIVLQSEELLFLRFS